MSKGTGILRVSLSPRAVKASTEESRKKGQGQWQRISWEDSLNEIAGKLMKVRDHYGAESIAFVDVSAKGLQDAVFRRFVNAIGSPNIISTDHICFVPRKSASVITYGFYAIPHYV